MSTAPVPVLEGAPPIIATHVEEVLDELTTAALRPVIEMLDTPQARETGMLLPGRLAMLYRGPVWEVPPAYTQAPSSLQYDLSAGFGTEAYAQFGCRLVDTEGMRWEGDPSYALFSPAGFFQPGAEIDERHHGSYFGRGLYRQRPAGGSGRPSGSGPRNPIAYAGHGGYSNMSAPSRNSSMRTKFGGYFGQAARGPCGPSTPGCGGGMAQGPAWDGGESYPAYSSGHYGGYFGGAQQKVHIVGEAAAVLIAAPYLWWASNQTDNKRAKWGLRALAAATMAVDGWLLWRNLRYAYSQNRPAA